MDALVERCCGLDVHQKTVVACCLCASLEAKPKAELKTFGTTTSELLELSDWLCQRQVSQVAMESTGIFWRPLVRHEAPRIRVGRKESHRWPVVAGC